MKVAITAPPIRPVSHRYTPQPDRAETLLRQYVKTALHIEILQAQMKKRGSASDAKLEELQAALKKLKRLNAEIKALSQDMPLPARRLPQERPTRTILPAAEHRRRSNGLEDKWLSASTPLTSPRPVKKSPSTTRSPDHKPKKARLQPTLPSPRKPLIEARPNALDGGWL